MEKNEGYILLHRCIQDNEWLCEEHKLSRFEIWVDMLFLARWQDSPRTFKIRGNKVVVNRGEIAESTETLSERWHWSRPSVIKIINEFEEQGMVTVERSKIVNKILIVNYDKYQLKGLQQKEQSQYIETSKNNEDFLQQNLQQNLQPFNKCLNNNIVCIGGEQNFLNQALNDMSWLEVMCMQTHSQLDDVKEWLQQFDLHCKAGGETHGDLNRYKAHFRDWVRYRIDERNKQQRQTKQQNNGVQAKYDPTGSYEPKSTREDYFL